MARPAFSTIDEYISSFPDGAVKDKLVEIRGIMAEAEPEAEETISYQIPCFKQNGKYVGYFAGFKDHISFYPIPREDKELTKQMEPYVAGKGTLHFKLDEPLPKELITKIVKYWVKSRTDAVKESR